MRLGIRRKLIGTLMLVGLFPLAMSLVVILGAGASVQLNKIRGTYEDTAASCAEHISDALLHQELEKLVLLARLPRVVNFVHDHGPAAAAPATGPAAELPIPVPTREDTAKDARWPSLNLNDPEFAPYLHNELAERLHLLSEVDGHPRQTMVTNAAGQLISCDSLTDDFFQADEAWWQAAFDHGRGRIYISSIIHNAPGVAGHLAEDVVEIALPIYQTADGKRTVVGIMKDELAVSWLLRTLRDIPEQKNLRAFTQLIDLDASKTVYAAADGSPRASTAPAASAAAATSAAAAAREAVNAAETERTEKFYFAHYSEPRVHALTLLFNDLIMGSAAVSVEPRLAAGAFGDVPMATAITPHWAVVVSKPSDEAMTPVYQLAMMVAGIGVGLILVLFILGVAISNREIIMPILRLREAMAAVGRGELNVRLLSNNPPPPPANATIEPESKRPALRTDSTFRKDELGELARDFDEMTRQLQKNVNQLARSNEAKRRFMELAGHELRTPVTYLLGVCQLAQRQLQQLSAAATDGAAEDATTTALAAKNAAAVTSALTKIATKTQRLSRIIDNLLKLVSNDQFTTRMVKQPVDMRALILQVTADHRPFIAERKQQLIVDVAENLPSIDADRDMLEDALTNLLSNAIRFSPDGSPIRVAAHLVEGDMLEILVEDSGPGIPTGDLNNLFEPFYTGADILHHHSGTFEFGSKGLGLGLAIVRRFIELHGGVVRAHPKGAFNSAEPAQRGTQFQILFPLVRSDGDGKP